MSHLRIFGSRACARIPLDKKSDLEPQSKEFIFVGYFEYSKGYNMINMRTKKSFIERSVQFGEEHIPTTEIRESSSPPPPLNVSEETNEIYDSDMFDNDDLISYPNSPTRPKWASNTIQEVGELARNPRDARRSRSHFESALSVKDPFFADNFFLMIESNPHTYEEASEYPIWKTAMKEEFHSLQKNDT